MEMVGSTVALTIACFLLLKLINSFYLKPLQTYYKLKNHGFSGPTPFFPLGNRSEMMNKTTTQEDDNSSTSLISHNIHSTCMPYFSLWQKSHGKVFVYWLGTEPFLYIADPEFLKQMSSEVAARNWGKPTVFKTDRQTLFGEFGLNMIESQGWVLHKRIIGPAFSSPSLKLIASKMVELTKKLTNQWTSLIASSSNIEMIIDVEKEISSLSAEIIAKTNFGLSYEEGKTIYNKLRAMQFVLFKNMYSRYIGVPYGQFLCPKETLKAMRLGNEIDDLLQSIISARRKTNCVKPQHDLLGLMLQGINADENKSVQCLTDREVIDECKAFFFAGYESPTLAISWTLVFLSTNKRWQEELRQEIKEVVRDGEIDVTTIARLKKMDWMMSEVLRLYPSAPSGVRRAKSDIKVGQTIIPEGTNIWVDALGMHHDPDLWGDDVHEFKPERFRDDPLHGGCRHNMGYIPFGFGGRMCAGKSYATMLYKIVLCSLLSRFSFAISPDYRHSPVYFFTLRPCHGVHLIVKYLDG